MKLKESLLFLRHYYLTSSGYIGKKFVLLSSRLQFLSKLKKSRVSRHLDKSFFMRKTMRSYKCLQLKQGSHPNNEKEQSKLQKKLEQALRDSCVDIIVKHLIKTRRIKQSKVSLMRSARVAVFLLRLKRANKHSNITMLTFGC